MLFDFALFLCLYREHFAFAVLVEHFEHNMVKFDDVLQKRNVMLFVVEQLKRKLRNYAQVVVEYVRLQNFSVFLIALV